MASHHPTPVVGFNVETIKTALQSNLQLQESLKKDLAQLQKKKRKNRFLAASYTQKLVPAASAVAEEDSTSHKWRRQLFAERKSRPAPNDDAKRRHANDSFFYHKRPPWNAKEIDRFHAVLQAETSSSSAAVNDVYERVASKLSGKKHAIARTAQECKVQHQRSEATPLNEEELAKLQALVNNSNQEENAIDWHQIAATMSSGRDQPCTPFQCLEAHKKGTSTRSSTLWTTEEDVALFKFLVAAGPQAVLDVRNPLVQHTLLEHVLPRKSRSKIFTRANASLLNPNFCNGDWTNTEERALAIYMKFYGQDVALVASHLRRHQKAVFDKWHRSLNPAFSTKPFTKQEDAALLDAMRSHPTYGWTELTTEFFPQRHPHRLANRWSELATDQDILDREAVMQSKKRKAQVVQFST